VAAGDLNNDGCDDLVVANSGDNNISILLSNGDGSFATAVNYSVGTTPTAVVLADFNLDGNLDVAVANRGSGNVSVLMGNGDGTLQTATNYTVGTNPVALAVGSVNDDGLPDLTVGNHGSNNLTVLANNGSGAFSVSQTIPLGESPDSVAVADFANNGVLYYVTDDKLVIGEPKPGPNPEKAGEAKGAQGVVLGANFPGNPQTGSGAAIAKVRIGTNQFGSWYASVGTFDHDTLKPQDWRGIFNVWFVPNKNTVNASTIAFVQVIKRTDLAGNLIVTNQTAKARTSAAGWRVDRSTNAMPAFIYPYYGWFNSGRPSQHTTSGSSPNPLTEAWMRDRPSSDVKGQIWSFQAFAIAKTGRQEGLVYGGVSWGLTIDKNGHVTPLPIEFLPTVTKEFSGAIDQWNTIAGVVNIWLNP